MFATVFAAFLIGHYLGDYFVQTDHQAQHKGLTGSHSNEGRRNCAKHAVTYTATLCGVLAVALNVEDVEFSVSASLVVWSALILNGITHYVIDRRWTLEALARFMGKSGWLDADREALPKLDQAAHVVLLGVFAFAIAALI
jgi:uncharacterized protein DUF3307